MEMKRSALDKVRLCTVRRDIPGSTAFVPSVAGLIIAGEVVRDLCGLSAVNKTIEIQENILT